MTQGARRLRGPAQHRATPLTSLLGDSKPVTALGLGPSAFKRRPRSTPSGCSHPDFPLHPLIPIAPNRSLVYTGCVCYLIQSRCTPSRCLPSSCPLSWLAKLSLSEVKPGSVTALLPRLTLGTPGRKIPVPPRPPPPPPSSHKQLFRLSASARHCPRCQGCEDESDTACQGRQVRKQILAGQSGRSKIRSELRI